MKDLLLRRESVMMAKVGHGLPLGYRELEYVKSEGNSGQYIMLDFVPDNTCGFACAVSLDQSISDDFFGGVRTSNSSYGRFAITSTGNYLYGSLGIATPAAYRPYVSTSSRVSISVNFLNSRKIKNGLCDTYTITNNFINTGSLKMVIAGGVNKQGTVQCSAQKTYEWIITKGSEIMYYFVPCLNASTGKAGLYDLCGNVCIKTGTPFFIPDSASLTAGPEIGVGG